MKYYSNILETVGNTPLVELTTLEKEFNLNARLFAKVEFFNPGGSVKDRIALKMIEEAEKSSLINQDTVIIEPTSGNTGIGLALICAKKGYRIIMTMPESMSLERRKLLKAYGAEIVLSKKELGMKGAVELANELAKQYPNHFIPSQFENPNNPLTHYLTTGREIYDGLDGQVDFFVAGFGTGGTVSGVGKFLKERKPYVKIIAVEPFESPLLSEGKAGGHKIQGIGANFIPNTLDKEILDEVMTIKGDDAIKMARLIAKKEGILVGISSGAALCAAIEVAKRGEAKGKNVVVLLPDTGERYLSTELFNE